MRKDFSELFTQWDHYQLQSRIARTMFDQMLELYMKDEIIMVDSINPNTNQIERVPLIDKQTNKPKTKKICTATRSKFLAEQIRPILLENKESLFILQELLRLTEQIPVKR